jgi:DNA sulfur modification protein DndB
MELAELVYASSNTLAKIIEPLRLETYGKERIYFGLGDYQGKRLIIHFPVYFSEIPALVSVVNRPINTTHIKEIKDYILNRIESNKAWILGSLTVNVNPDDIHYQPHGFNLYVVRIPNGTRLHIADGQHRIQAITELMGADEHRRKISNEQIPLTLVLDSSESQAALDFRDMQEQIVLPPAMLVGFSWEGRNGIAHALVEKVPIFSYTAIDKAVPGTGTKNIYTISYIASFVGSAIAGNPSAPLLEYDTQELIENAATNLSDKLNRFFFSCPCTAPLVAKEELTVADVAFFKSNSILALASGLEILGHLIHSRCATPEQLATGIDWSRTSDWWKDLATPNDSNTGKLREKVKRTASASQIAERAIVLLKSIGEIDAPRSVDFM